MIRHRPLGRGHAYRLEPDQRVPAWPVAGQPIELRATTERGADAPVIELQIDGRLSRLDTEPFNVTSDHARTEDGHLATAASGEEGGGRSAWRAIVPPQPAATRLRYRFSSKTGTGTR